MHALHFTFIRLQWIFRWNTRNGNMDAEYTNNRTLLSNVSFRRGLVCLWDISLTNGLCLLQTSVYWLEFKHETSLYEAISTSLFMIPIQRWSYKHLLPQVFTSSMDKCGIQEECAICSAVSIQVFRRYPVSVHKLCIIRFLLTLLKQLSVHLHDYRCNAYNAYGLPACLLRPAS